MHTENFHTLNLRQVKIRSISSNFSEWAFQQKPFRIGTMVAAVPQLHASKQRRWSKISKQKHPVRTGHPFGLSLVNPIPPGWFTRWSTGCDMAQDIAFEDHKDPTELSLTPSKPQVFSPPVATVAVAIPPTETDMVKSPEHARLKFKHSQRLNMESKQLFCVLLINVIWSHLSGWLKVNHFYQRLILPDPLYAIEMLFGSIWVSKNHGC